MINPGKNSPSIPPVWSLQTRRLKPPNEVLEASKRGAWSLNTNHSRVNSQYGWEIDHVFPKAKLKERGIPEDTWDDLINLRPFHADNNRKKSDDYPDYTREKVMNKETHKNITLEKAKIVNPEVQKAINEHYGFNDEIMNGEEDDDW